MLWPVEGPPWEAAVSAPQQWCRDEGGGGRARCSAPCTPTELRPSAPTQQRQSLESAARGCLHPTACLQVFDAQGAVEMADGLLQQGRDAKAVANRW